jgi:uncharacterized protein
MNLPSNIIPRNNYVELVRPYMRKNLIKVLTGQRRVGKSYLLFQLIQLIQKEEENASIIYINKEDLAFDFIRDAKTLHDYILQHLRSDGRNYIFIDEIQDIEEFEKALRSLLLNENNDLYITGSNSKMLSGELASHLSGRYIEFNIYSLSYLEFLQFHKLADSDESLELYIKYGGLPYLVNLALTDQAFEYIQSVYTTIVYRDVINRYKLRNNHLLERLVLFLADNIGSLFSANSISDFLRSQQIRGAHNQIQQFSEYLANAFIIHQLNRYDIVGKRIFETGSKFYFENTGIRNAIRGYSVKDRGKLLENLVCNHLLYLGFELKVGTRNNYEIDFIAGKNSERIYVQVALQIESAETSEREFGNLLKIEDNYAKLVVTGVPFTGNTYEGIKIWYIRDFLKLKAIL